MNAIGAKCGGARCRRDGRIESPSRVARERNKRSQRDDIERADQIARATTRGSAGSRNRASRTAPRDPGIPSSGARSPATTSRKALVAPTARNATTTAAAIRLEMRRLTLARRYGSDRRREHRDGRVGRERIGEGLDAPDRGNADGEQHHRVEETSMIDRNAPEASPRESPPRATRIAAARCSEKRCTAATDRQVRDQRRRQPEDCHQL